MGKVFNGNPGGAVEEIGMSKYSDQRRRSVLIQSALFLMRRGGVLPHMFMSPPSKMGIYVISHCLKAGEFWRFLVRKFCKMFRVRAITLRR